MLLYNRRCVLNLKVFYAKSSRTVIHRHSFLPLQSKLHLLNNPSFQSVRQLSWTSGLVALYQSPPVLKFQEYLTSIHDSTGLPWWIVIMLTTFSIRSCIVFPLTVHQHQVIARLENVRRELNEMGPELNKEVNMAAKMLNWDKRVAKTVFNKSMKEYFNKFVVRDNCHPFKVGILVLFQVPFWICFSMALRCLTYSTVLPLPSTHSIFFQMQVEGVLWFTDLTMPDKFFIPVLLGIINITLTEIHALRRMGKRGLLQKILLNVSRVFVLFVSAAATVNPASVTFYWLCSSTIGLGQNILLMFPAVRRALNIPKTPSESSTPFQDIADNLKKRLQK